MSNFTDLTRELFAPLITKPPLTDHLLQRPPFKFIVDVAAATIQNTGYLRELFGSDQVDSAKITDKTAKINFLETLIDVLNDDGSLDEVKPSKIVAGKEPELTNLMLQKLASEAMRHRESNSASSNKENSTKPSSKTKSKPSDSKVKTKRKENSEATKKKEKEKEKENGRSTSKSKPSTRSSSHTRKPSISKEASEKKTRSKSKSKVKNEVQKQPLTSPKEDEPTEVNNESNHLEESALILTDVVADKQNGEAFPEQNDAEPVPPPNFTRPVTSSGRPQTSMGRPGTSMARPAPPKLHKKQIAVIERPTEVPVVEEAEVITDERGEDQQADDFLVLSEPEIEIPLVSAQDLDSEDHGNLVKKMLETKMGIEAADSANRTEVFDESSQQKIHREINNLQAEIQHMTQTSHPLARLFDFVQEDFEGMLKEVDEWRKEVKKNSNLLRDQSGYANEQQYARAVQLKQLDQEIKDVRANIARVRASVLSNEEKIMAQMINI